MMNYWDERFSIKEYVYGENPNVFFEAQLRKLKPGTILLPCEGEGRNAVFAALSGWIVKAFDSSQAGKAKAMQLAGKKKVTIDYILEDASVVSFPNNSFDLVAFIYAHFPADTRKQIHQKAISWLKPGGKIILEAFNPKQLKNNSGGPKELTMLYTEEILRDDFKELTIELIETPIVELNEGQYHKGKAEVIQFIATKK